MANNQAEQAIYNRLVSAPTFHPVTADLFLNDWGLDAGDVVTVRADNTDYTVPVYNMNLNWNGTTRAQIQSTGNEKRKPLSALRRRQYYGRSSAHQEITEQGTVIESRFIQQDEKIGMVVEEKDGELVVNAASIVAGINSQDKTSTSYVDISADKINLTGYVKATDIEAEKAVIDQLISRSGYSGKLYVGDLSVTSTVSALTVAAGYVQGSQLWLLDGEGQRETRITGAGVTRFGTASSSAGQITIPYFTYESGNTQAGTINFNIADTAYYQSHVGVDSISSSGGWKYSSENGYYNTITATGKDGSTKSADIWPPYITVVPSLGTTSTGSVVAQGPDSHNISSPISLYLKKSGNYVYLTKTDATPVEGTNVVAKISAPTSSGTITAITNGTLSYDSEEVKLLVPVTASGTNVSSYTTTLKFSTSTSVGGWTDNYSKNTVTVKVGGVTVGSATVTAPSVDYSISRYTGTATISHYIEAGSTYRLRLFRGSTTVKNVYLRGT